MDGVIRAPVFPISVGEFARRYHCVVKSGIEYGPGILVRGLDPDLLQLFVPGLAGCFGGGLEIPAVQFGGHIGTRFLFAHR